MRLVFSGNDNMLMSVASSNGQCSSQSSVLLGNSVTRPPHSLISMGLLLLKSSPPIDMASCSTNQPLTFSHHPSAIRAKYCDREQCERVSSSSSSGQCCQLQPWTSGGEHSQTLAAPAPPPATEQENYTISCIFLKILP